MSMFAPGVTAKELYTLCKDKCTALGLNFACPHIGHSLGIGLHEFPMLSPKEDFALEENMVFNIEPIIRQNGRMFHQEDLVQVTRTVIRSCLWTTSIPDIWRSSDAVRYGSHEEVI